MGTISAINQQYPDFKKNQGSIEKRPFSVLSRRFIKLNGEATRESESGARENPDRWINCYWWRLNSLFSVLEISSCPQVQGNTDSQSLEIQHLIRN